MNSNDSLTLEEFLEELDNISNQLCRGVDGEFGFRVEGNSTNEIIQKHCMLINFTLSKASEQLEIVRKQKEEIELASKMLHKTTEDLAKANAVAQKQLIDIEVKNRRILEIQKKLIEAEKLKTASAMIVTYNHEILNPLTIALGTLELLLRKCEDEEQKSEFEIIKTSLLRVTEILQSIKEIETKEHIEFETYANSSDKIKLAK